MVDMMDVGCGHNIAPFDKTRAEMYDMMTKKAPETRAQKALRKIARNRRRAVEAVLFRKSPMFPPKSPVSPQKSLVFSQKSPVSP